MLNIIFDEAATNAEVRRAAYTLVEIIDPDLLKRQVPAKAEPQAEP